MKILKKIFILLQSKVWFYGLLNGVAANIELKNFLKKINSINTLVDIGSNKGQFILLLERYFPNLKVYSFEPIKEILNKQTFMTILIFKLNHKPKRYLKMCAPSFVRKHIRFEIANVDYFPFINHSILFGC